MICKKFAFETNSERDAPNKISNKREELKMELFNSLTLDSQQSLVAWEAALPNTTSEHYRTMPENGDFTLVAIAYNSDDSIYDTAKFEASRNITAILDAVIMKSKSKTIGCP